MLLTNANPVWLRAQFYQLKGVRHATMSQDSYYSNGKWWTYGERDNPFTYVYRQVQYTLRMVPRARRYGIRYLYDRQYRKWVRRKQRGSATLRKIQKQELYKRCKGVCAGCHNFFGYQLLTLDHMLPYTHPKYKELQYLQLLCTPCHTKKDATPPRKRRFWGIV